jgi:hypothetical protein
MRRSQTSTEPVCTQPSIHEIRPTAVYFVDDARRILRLKQSTIRREVRDGRLRIAKRAGRYYLLGEWILEWLRGGEVKRGQPNNDNGTEIRQA